jgi:hypothetical protein
MKKEINRVLGNSLRCILPSFWWKRLLGMMSDRIDSAQSAANNAQRTAVLIASEISSELSNKQDKLYSGSNIKTINGSSLLGSGNLEIKSSSDITVDAQMSASSTNPVQNKVVKAYVDEAVAGSGQSVVVDSALSTSSTNPVQNKVVTTTLNAKADKTSIPTKTSDLINDNGFLTKHQDISHLASKMYVDEQNTTKQSVISDIDEIRAGAAKGATAIQEHQDISHLATQYTVDTLTRDVIDNEEITAAAFKSVNKRIETLENNVSGSTVTKEEFYETIDNYATTEFVEGAVDKIDEAIADLNKRIDEEKADIVVDVPLLNEWDDFDRETMKGYALGAALGHDTFELVEDMDVLLEKVNGSLGDEQYVIPNGAVVYGELKANDGATIENGIKTDNVSVDGDATISGIAKIGTRLEIGDANITWDKEKGKATFNGLDIPVGAFRTEELEDIVFKTPLTDGQSLTYDASLNAFTNKTITGGNSGPLLRDWNYFQEETMEDYGLSAKLGYELHSQVNGLDSLIDEISGETITTIDMINGEII